MTTEAEGQSEESISERVHRILSDITGVDPESLTAETPVSDLPNMDSLAFVEAATILEEYGIEVDDEKLLGFQTVGEFYVLFEPPIEG